MHDTPAISSIHPCKGIETIAALNLHHCDDVLVGMQQVSYFLCYIKMSRRLFGRDRRLFGRDGSPWKESCFHHSNALFNPPIEYLLMFSEVTILWSKTDPKPKKSTPRRCDSSWTSSFSGLMLAFKGVSHNNGNLDKWAVFKAFSQNSMKSRVVRFKKQQACFFLVILPHLPPSNGSNKNPQLSSYHELP